MNLSWNTESIVTNLENLDYLFLFFYSPNFILKREFQISLSLSVKLENFQSDFER